VVDLVGLSDSPTDGIGSRLAQAGCVPLARVTLSRCYPRESPLTDRIYREAASILPLVDAAGLVCLVVERVTYPIRRSLDRGAAAAVSLCKDLAAIAWQRPFSGAVTDESVKLCGEAVRNTG
jgi:hypothetical protein